jgi:hypothetical protein
MAKTVDKIMEEIADRIRKVGYAPDVALSLTRLPASLLEEHKFRRTPAMKQAVKEAEARHSSLNDVIMPCWNLCVVVSGGFPIVPGGLYAQSARTACNKMLVLVKMFCKQHGKGKR